MKSVEHKQELSKFWLPLTWVFIPNTRQYLHPNWFTSIMNVNFELTEILKHLEGGGDGGVDSLLNISPPPPQKKNNSNGVRSGDLKGHTFGPTLPINLPGKQLFRNCVTLRWKWGGASSCWKKKESLRSSSCDITHSSITSRYAAIKKDRYTLFADKAQNTFNFGLSLACCIILWGFSRPHICTLRQLTFPDCLLYWHV
jgi:hypothetical protein